MNKVTIIGTGSVGSTIAYTLAVNGGASEIVMIDLNEEKALGEALDIRQGMPFCSPVSIYAGSYRMRRIPILSLLPPEFHASLVSLDWTWRRQMSILPKASFRRLPNMRRMPLILS